MKTQKGNISKSMIIEGTIDQTECIENTQPLPQRNQQSILRRLMGEINRLKAERARFLNKRQRRAKPETERLFPRWGKRRVFLNPKPEHTVFSTPSLIFLETSPQFCPSRKRGNIPSIKII